MTPQHLSILFVLVGLLLYFWGLLMALSRVKGKRVGWRWLWSNRRYKLQQSAVAALFCGYLAYLWFDPAMLILEDLQDRREMAKYLGTQLVVGFLNSLLLDLAGNLFVSKTGAHARPVREFDDDGKTLIDDDWKDRTG